MKSIRSRAAQLLAALLWCAASLPAAEVAVSAPDSALLRFALGKLEASLHQRGDTMKRVGAPAPDQSRSLTITVAPNGSDGTGTEGYRLERARGGSLIASGGGERGVMYGVLDVAEQIRLGTPLSDIKERTVEAQFAFRAIKFNLPWAAYRTSPAIEQHQETCRDLKFWEAFLDMMAENRFNVLSLWSLHPFHYMVRPANFPEACPFSEASWKDDAERSLIDIDKFIKHPVLDTKRYINIADFVQPGATVAPGKLSPPALAAQLDREGATALQRVAAVRRRARPSPALECELTDIEAWCAYGAYFAEKLRGGVALAQARATKDGRKQQEAVLALEKALGHWQRLAELGARFNQLPIPSNSKEPFSWAQLTPAVQRDVVTARAGL